MTVKSSWLGGSWPALIRRGMRLLLSWLLLIGAVVVALVPGAVTLLVLVQS